MVALSMPINSFVERLEKLYDTMFGLCLEKDKGILGQFAKIREIERAFELKRKELVHKESKLKKYVMGIKCGLVLQCSFGKLVRCGQSFAFPRQCMSLGSLLCLTLTSFFLAEHDLEMLK
ncbi:hypothetical protein D8674_021676 [Pyrus ussuriensis x Pyrus communis]|uniref:Uncharacterized protein n=1 Tax=Pyrus ussuriensis x Pyrus communis TaxID=2448454 RepID=A0A5N5GG88_9ROSA|nr:hypothetical protein D8674_040638 [Pyrus ussuriensis x Pyrus communis]KAB2615088.1 hypothetical protein D8674_021676 [Pyrus ussuriensis x Pyrus communis]